MYVVLVFQTMHYIYIMHNVAIIIFILGLIITKYKVIF